ncbi:MAG: ABC transporter permease subunit [Aeromicrobium sp.]
MTSSSALRFVAPIVVGVIIVALWLLVVDVLHAAPRALPSPLAIGSDLGAHGDIIGEDVLITATNAILGLLAGSLAGIILAGLAAAWRPVDGMLAPLVAAIAVVPIVAVTPILNTMFGASSQFGRVAVAAIASFVPVFVNVLRGLRQTRPVHRDLLRASGATGAQTFRVLTLPTAVPYLLTGLRIAASLAVISALVAEYFGGPIGGLGKSITSAASSSNYPLAWAYVLGAIVLGLVFYCVALLAEMIATRHQPGART